MIDRRRLLRAIAAWLEARVFDGPFPAIRSAKLDATETFIVVRCEDGRSFVVEVREEVSE